MRKRPMANRVTFLVDGFNLYFSVRHAETALRASNLQVADFKRKSFSCPHCGRGSERFEEKETDVALGVKAIELLHLGACDTLVIVSGDTDFAENQLPDPVRLSDGRIVRRPSGW